MEMWLQTCQLIRQYKQLLTSKKNSYKQKESVYYLKTVSQSSFGCLIHKIQEIKNGNKQKKIKEEQALSSVISVNMYNAVSLKQHIHGDKNQTCANRKDGNLLHNGVGWRYT